ncbi:hypothetical protein ES703_23055 [subsurface metagenome]
MIPTDIVRQKTGLTTHQLNYLHRLRLLPSATRIHTIGQVGSTCAYPATIFTRIRVIEFLRGHGLTLAQIAQAARGTPFECPPPAPRAHRKVNNA